MPHYRSSDHIVTPNHHYHVPLKLVLMYLPLRHVPPCQLNVPLVRSPKLLPVPFPALSAYKVLRSCTRKVFLRLLPTTIIGHNYSTAGQRNYSTPLSDIKSLHLPPENASTFSFLHLILCLSWPANPTSFQSS